MRTYAIEASDLPRFLAVERALYGGEADWIPPIRAQLESELGGQSAFFRDGRLRLFLCEEEGRPLGRVAALINPRLRDANGALVGQLGYFATVPEVTVLRDLIDAGAAWLAKAGARSLYAPMNGGAHRLHRLLVDGCERPPFLFEPRNPSAHAALFAACGLAPLHRWYSYEIDRAAARRLHAQVARLLEARPPLGHVELIDPRDLGRALARLHPLLDGLWQGHIGYVPIALDELAEAFAGALQLMTERHLGVLVEQGRDVGCAFMYPDFVDEARALAGDASGWARWDARPSRLVMHTVALLPAARGRTGALALIERGLRHMLEDGYENLLVALVTEELRFFESVVRPSRTYALYGRTL